MGKRKESLCDSKPKMKKQKSKDMTENPALLQVREGLKLPQLSFKEKLADNTLTPRVPSETELEELDHIIVNLAYQTEQLVSKFQWLSKVDTQMIADRENTDVMVRSLLDQYRVRLAYTLVKQYWGEGIPVFDYILSSRHSMKCPLLSPGWESDVSEDVINEMQALVVKSAIESIQAIKKRKSENLDFLKHFEDHLEVLRRKTGDDVTNDDNAKNKGEGSNNSVDETDWPPKLPEIRNVNLLRQVFTHKSAIVNASMMSKADLFNVHNERLEFKGDSILDFIICQQLYTEFPDDSEGSLTIKKASLVCNDTLFDLSVAYKLHERLRMSTDLHGKVYNKPTDKLPDFSKKNKAISDVFEAYVAGVAIDRGLPTVQHWLLELYKPMFQNMKSGFVAGDVDKNAKNELYRKVGSAEQTIAYKALNDTSPFVVACVINGREVSRGTDRTIKLAGLRAAEAALADSKTVEKYASKRRETQKTAPNTGHLPITST